MRIATTLAALLLAVVPAFAEDRIPAEGQTACLNATRAQSEMAGAKLDGWAGSTSTLTPMGEWQATYTFTRDGKEIQVRCIWDPKTGKMAIGAAGVTMFNNLY